MEPVEFEWVPAQDVTKQGPDFRSLETSVRGFKIGHSSTANTTKTQPAVKAIAQAELRQTDADDMMEACDVEGSIAAPGTVQPRDVQGIGTKSSRSWKLASTARTSASVKKSKSSWDQKMKQKKERKLNQINSQEAKQKYKDAVKQREQQKAASLKTKEENRKKNDAAQGQVLSAAAAKKLMKNKKQHKDLVTC